MTIFGTPEVGRKRVGVLLLLFILLIILSLVLFLFWNRKSANIKNVTEIADNENYVEIAEFIERFEKSIQSRDPNKVLSYFTPPQNPKDIAEYENLMGINPPIENPRLFNTVSSNFILVSWTIINSDSIEKNCGLGDAICLVIVEETRKSWCNADPCAGTYSFENTAQYALELKKMSDGWRIEKYYSLGQTNGGENRRKYGGLL